MNRSVATHTEQCDFFVQSSYPGYRLSNVCRDDDGTLVLELSPKDKGVQCPECGRYCRRFHETRVTQYLDFQMLEVGSVRLRVKTRRLRCRCGCRVTEPAPAFILPGHRITKRLAYFIQKLLQMRVTVKDISKLTGVTWDIIKKLDMAGLQEYFAEPDISNARCIAIDEISIHKGHRYATVFMDLENQQVLRVVEGKSQDALTGVFEELAQRHKDLPFTSVSVDMNAGFPGMVRKYLPGCQLGYDLFHVMQLFNRRVLVEAKKLSMQRARADFKALPKKERTEQAYNERDRQLHILSNAQWLVIMDPDKLKCSQQERLEALREHNKLFGDIYPLVAMLRSVWRAETKEMAEKILTQVIEICGAIAKEHEFKPIAGFARTLKNRFADIITSCLVKYGTNMLEGANNTAKVIKRIAYGYRDFEYFALKIKAAFPGKAFKEKCKELGPTLLWRGSVESLKVPQIN